MIDYKKLYDIARIINRSDMLFKKGKNIFFSDSTLHTTILVSLLIKVDEDFEVSFSKLLYDFTDDNFIYELKRLQNHYETIKDYSYLPSF